MVVVSAIAWEWILHRLATLLLVQVKLNIRSSWDRNQDGSSAGGIHSSSIGGYGSFQLRDSAILTEITTDAGSGAIKDFEAFDFVRDASTSACRQTSKRSSLLLLLLPLPCPCVADPCGRSTAIVCGISYGQDHR